MSTPGNVPPYVQYGVPITYIGCFEIQPTEFASPIPSKPSNAADTTGITDAVQHCLSQDSMEQYAYIGSRNDGTNDIATYTCNLNSLGKRKNDFDCKTTCSGQSNAICGTVTSNLYSVYYMNTYANSVAPYQLKQPTELALTQTSAKPSYVGCFPVQSLSNAAPSSISSTFKLDSASMTVEMCNDYCAQNSQPYAWIRSSTHCFCGDQRTLQTNFATYPDDACDAPCPGYTDGSSPAGGTAKCGGKDSNFANNPSQVRVSLYHTVISSSASPVSVQTPLSGDALKPYTSAATNTSVNVRYIGCADVGKDPIFADAKTNYSTTAVPYGNLLTIQQCLHACDPKGGPASWALISSKTDYTLPNGQNSGGCRCIYGIPSGGKYGSTAEAGNTHCVTPAPGDNQHTIGESNFVSVYAQYSAPAGKKNFTDVASGVPVTYSGCYTVDATFDTDETSSMPITAGYTYAAQMCLSQGFDRQYISILSTSDSSFRVACTTAAQFKTKVDDSFCSVSCGDDLNVGCGGKSVSTATPPVTTLYASVYVANSYAFSIPPYPLTKPAELNTSIISATMNYQGCLRVKNAPSDLRTVLNSATLTQSTCIDLCLQYGFTLAVMQNATICGCSSQSYNGNANPVDNPESNCNAPCPGYIPTNSSEVAPTCGSVEVPKKKDDKTPDKREVEEYVPYASVFQLTTTFKLPRVNSPTPLGSFNYSSLMNNDTLAVSYKGCYPISDPVLQKGPYRPMSLPYPKLMTIEQCIHACDPNGGPMTHPVLKQIANVNWPNGANSECQCISGASANLTAKADETKCFSLLPGDNTHTMGYDDYVSVYAVAGPFVPGAPGNDTPSTNTTVSTGPTNTTVSTGPTNTTVTDGPTNTTVTGGPTDTPGTNTTISGGNNSTISPSDSTISTPTTPPPPAATPTVVSVYQVNGLTYRSQGCWGEPAQQPSPLRALPTRLYPARMTVQSCLTLASSQGFKKAGLENGGECWASNGQVAGGAIPASYCTTACADDSSSYCGGSNNLNLYFADGASSGAATVPAHTSGSYRWTYSSCWGEPGQGRALPVKIIDSGSTVEACLDLAASRGYGYAGLEWYGECWASFNAPWGGQIDESYCNLACSSNGNQLCGGSGALSYYKLTAQNKPTVSIRSNGQQSTWRFQSCFGEPAQGRSMPNPFDNAAGATIESCLQMGTDAGFRNCGLEYGQECWCSNQAPFGGQIPDSYCNMPCNKDNRELCGGGNVLSFYSRN